MLCDSFKHSGIRSFSTRLRADGTCLFCDFLNNRMVHPSTKNGTICLYDYVVFSAILRRSVSAGRMDEAACENALRGR
jgi:hypothetical protein